MMFVIIHYAEIGIKGKNRLEFEDLLVDNVQRKCQGLQNPVRVPGALVFSVKKGAEENELIQKLKQIPGIAYFSFAIKSTHDMDRVIKDTLMFLKGKEFSSFKVEAKRRDKNAKLRSQQLNRELGAAVLEKFDTRVDVHNPLLTIRPEITSKETFVSLERIDGVGGLPTDPKKKVVVLLSGGIDSPVAAYMMMKRGCAVEFVHVHNNSHSSNAVADKIKELAKHLAKFQQQTHLHMVPFDDIQKEIIKNVAPDLRMLVFRACMFKLAGIIAKKNKARAVVVGDALSQVASQTLPNIEATYVQSDYPVLAPLIGMDKSEISAVARRIETFEISSLPYPDCCSLIVAKHPKLNARVEQVKEEIEKITGALFQKAVDAADVQSF